MFCTKCGKQIEDGSRFCPYCGMPQGKTGDLSEGQKIPNIHRMSNASRVPHTPSEPNVQNTSKASARAIENFIIKFMAADWTNKVYFILAVIFSVRIAVFLIPEIFVFPWTSNWMSIRGIIAACLVYYGTAALIVDTVVYWFRSIHTMELSTGKKARIDSVLLGVWMILIKLLFSKMNRTYTGKIMVGIYVAARRYLPVAGFIIAIVIACGVIRIIKMQQKPWVS